MDLQPIEGIPALVAAIAKNVGIFSIVMVVVAYATLAERRVSAFIQDRRGPNRVGPFGLLQPIADGIKNILKEETLPATASRFFFVLAPILVLVPSLVTFAVIPFGQEVDLFGKQIGLWIGDINVGLLYLLAIAGLGSYGIVLGGWSSNNKYSLLGALRAAAQMISY